MGKEEKLLQVHVKCSDKECIGLKARWYIESDFEKAKSINKVSCVACLKPATVEKTEESGYVLRRLSFNQRTQIQERYQQLDQMTRTLVMKNDSGFKKEFILACLVKAPWEPINSASFEANVDGVMGDVLYRASERLNFASVEDISFLVNPFI